MSRPKAYIFDVFGTLVDWRNSVAREVSSCFADRPQTLDGIAFADAWRGHYQPAMETIRSGQRGYTALDQLHLENLEKTLSDFGLDDALSDAEKRALNTAWEKLDPWPDVVSGLATLKGKAIIAPCSNGSIALMTRLAKYADLPWDCVLGADIAKAYKPDPAVYHACASALRLQPDEVMMVAAHNSDLVAARACGLKTAFVARPTEYGEEQTADLHAEEDWDRIVSRIGDLA